ncbi:MAG: adenylate/guanylate cyclase domain-containing protein, partial [Microcoleus sp.]
IVVVIPESDFMAQINANNRTTILLCIVALIGSIIIGILTARWVTKPILQLNETAKDIAKANWHQSREINRNDEVGQLAKSFNSMAQQLQDSFEALEGLTHQQARLIAELKDQESYLQALNESFVRFVPRQFLQLLKKNSFIDIQLGEQIQQEISVLFSDIRDFTSLSESMAPEDNFKFINGYLSRMEPAIIENHGFIDKYIGDAIMALFSGDADRAVTAGISMLQRLAEYNITRIQSDRLPIKIGIGINTGKLILGTVGGQSRMDGTVIGDAVNLASRLEGLTKHYGVPLLISDRTFMALTNHDNYHIRFIDRVKVKGKSEQVGVYEVFDADLPELRQGKLASKTDFERAIVYYYTSNTEAAFQLLKQCLQANPGDKVAQLYLQRCQ